MSSVSGIRGELSQATWFSGLFVMSASLVVEGLGDAVGLFDLTFNTLEFSELEWI